MDLELLGTQSRTVPRRRLGWMLLLYLLALAMNKMTWTYGSCEAGLWKYCQLEAVKLSSIHLDKRLGMF